MKPRGPARGAALVAVLWACGESGGRAPPVCEQCWCAPAPDAPAADVTLGRFDGTVFTPLADGDTLDIHAGPQGGHHFLVAVRTRSVDLASARTLLSASQGGADVDALSCPNHKHNETKAKNSATLPGDVPLVLAETWLASGAVEGASVTVRVEVQDDRGAYGFDEHTVLAHRLP